MRNLAIIVATVLIAAIASLCAPAVSAQIEAGDRAPAITVESITNTPDGRPRSGASWSDFEGRTVLLEFWGTWCPPCVASIPHLNEIAEEPGDERYAYLSGTYEDESTVGRSLRTHDMHAMVGHDTNRSMVSAYGIRGWPTAFIVRDGRVLFRGHPSQLSADMIRGLVGDQGSERTGRTPDEPREVEAGSDRDDPTVIEVVARETEMDQGSYSISRTSAGVEMRGVTLRAVLAELWGVDQQLVDGRDEVDLRRRLDVRFRGPEAAH